MVDEDLVGVVGVDVERVEARYLCELGVGGVLEVLLLELARLRVLVSEDEVDLVGGSALEGSWLAWRKYA